MKHLITHWADTTYALPGLFDRVVALLGTSFAVDLKNDVAAVKFDDRIELIKGGSIVVVYRYDVVRDEVKIYRHLTQEQLDRLNMKPARLADKNINMIVPVTIPYRS